MIFEIGKTYIKGKYNTFKVLNILGNGVLGEFNGVLVTAFPESLEGFVLDDARFFTHKYILELNVSNPNASDVASYLIQEIENALKIQQQITLKSESLIRLEAFNPKKL